jgi:hypothetical protein
VIRKRNLPTFVQLRRLISRIEQNDVLNLDKIDEILFYARRKVNEDDDTTEFDRTMLNLIRQREKLMKDVTELNDLLSKIVYIRNLL